MKFIFQYIAVFTVYVPVGAVLIYIIDRGFSKDIRVNLIFSHAILAVLSQLAMILMGLAAIENIIVMKCYLGCEMFLISLFYLQFFPSLANSTKYIYSILLTCACYVMAFLDNTGIFPIYSILFNGIVLLTMGLLVIKRINSTNLYEKGFMFFVAAIVIYSVGYTTTYFYIDAIPALAVRIQAIVSIIKYILITIGIYQFYRYFNQAPRYYSN